MINGGILKRWGVTDESRTDTGSEGLVPLPACLHVMTCHSPLPPPPTETPISHEPKYTFPPASCSVSHSVTVT